MPRVTFRNAPKMGRAGRTALSLIEVLVVLALIALLIGLLMPAVQRARESANYIKCRHQLRQICLAIHNYEVANGYFPGLGKGLFQDSALARILPYIEQTNLHGQIVPNQPLYTPIGDSVHLNPAQANAAKSLVNNFICPSDAQSPYFSNHDQATTAGSNYVVNAGTGTGLYFDFRYPNDGVFWHGSQVRHKDMRDGLSSTLMVSEALLGAGTDAYGEIQPDPRRQWMNVACSVYPNPDRPGTIPPLTDEHCMSMTMPGMIWRGDRGASWIGGPGHRVAFNTYLMPNDAMHDCGAYGIGRFKASSAHPGGVNMVLGDGSVHFIKDHIELSVWRALSTRDDGEVLGSYCGCK
jgi:prepilin-type processing-associated H-X9-DG protein